MRADNFCDGGSNCKTAATLATMNVYDSPHDGQSMSSRTAAYRNVMVNGSDVTYYSANDETATYLCRKVHGYQFGYWRDCKLPTSSGWAPYHNLSIMAYDATASNGKRVLCNHGSTCNSNKFPFGDRLHCFTHTRLPGIGTTQP